ncbi:hypothetical protein A2U01_0004777 [Trifolium medium]|uniref:Uncharacterized protein n=1 Tax=Trifolium medium TaxID=97028 RepID=A0A392M8Y1_9FABA|nr:hypothetical protein [Trifolium medium]
METGDVVVGALNEGNNDGYGVDGDQFAVATICSLDRVICRRHSALGTYLVPVLRLRDEQSKTDGRHAVFAPLLSEAEIVLRFVACKLHSWRLDL